MRRTAEGQSLLQISTRYDPFYLISIGLLAFIKNLGGAHWATVILFTNAAFYAFCAPVVFLLYRKFGGPSSLAAAIGSAILPLGYPEALILGVIPLRDIPFAGAAAIATLLILILANINKRYLGYVLALCLCLFLTIFRPNSIILFAATTALFVWLYIKGGKMQSGDALIVLGIQFVLGASALLFFAFWFSDPFKLPTQNIDNLFMQIRAINQMGAIIIDHPDTYVNDPNSFGDYLWLLSIKFVNYFRYWNPMQSTWHLIYRHIYFGVLFANFIYCVYGTLKASNQKFNYDLKQAVFFAVSLAIAGATLHSVLVLAFEFRYQMIVFPTIWALLLLNATKIYAVLNRR